MASEPIRRRVVVHGDVQGVFFRDSTRERAQ
ncbi:MAG: acylphosphatase, partial [Solirubrobacterales bacterium]|nr:acylphosphatase [Solirubrobacterales bacterium]